MSASNGEATSNNGVSVTATITTATPTVITRETAATLTTAEEPPAHERRPSWRLRVDNGSKVRSVLLTFFYHQ